MLLKNIVAIIAIVISGCAYDVPFAPDLIKDMRQSQLVREKMPIKVGIYLSDDLKQYIYNRQKIGAILPMRVGDYVLSTAMTMGSAMFDEVVWVNALPPYDESYRPEVEAVIRPEILFYYADTVGAFTGYIKARTKLRVTGYDLGGNVLWQDEAIGESTSKNTDFVNSLLGDTEAVSKTGEQAVFAAAAHIINGFYAAPPQGLVSFVEIKKAGILKSRAALPDFELFKALYENGQFQYRKKNYYQSLYLFVKASSIAPDEPGALFYTGASYTHTGEKSSALKKFADVIEKKASGPEARDAKKWIQRLDDPLKIGVIGVNNSTVSALNDGAIQDALVKSGMYQIIDTAKLIPSGNLAASRSFSRFLDNCYKQGIKVVILHDVDSFSEKAQSDHYSGEDLATEHRVKISAKVYSTKKKHLKTEVDINESAHIIQGQSVEEEKGTKQQLLQNGAKKLVLHLLKNDIF